MTMFLTHPNHATLSPLKAGLIGITTVGLLLSTLAFAGDIYTVQGMTFEQVASGTKISVEATSGVPYRLLNSSDKQIVLEIDSVDPNRAISTDFSRSDAIHHVTLKPLSANSLRVSIYGQKLGHPFIQFKSPSYTALSLASSSTTGGKSKSNPHTSPRAVASGPDAKNAEAFALEAFHDVEGAGQTTPAAADSGYGDAPESNAIVGSDTVETTQAALSTDRQAFTTSETIDLEEEPTNEDAPWEGLLTLLGKTLVESPSTLLYAVAAILGLGIGLFSIVKIALAFRQRKQLTQRVKSLLNRHNSPQIGAGQRNPFGHSPFARGFSGQNLAATANIPLQGPQPIRGLNPTANQLIAKTQAQQVYQKAPKVVPPARQALNSRNSAAEPKLSQNELDQQLQKSLDMTTSWGRKPASNQAKPASKWNKPAAAQAGPKFPAVTQQVETAQQANKTPKTAPTGSRKGKAPTMPQQNEDVISFLRNVAELMEKDGQADLASDIKKSLR